MPNNPDHLAVTGGGSMPTKYVKPEIVDLAELEAFGACTAGSVDATSCSGNGGTAGPTGPGYCNDNGLIAGGDCNNGSSPNTV